MNRRSLKLLFAVCLLLSVSLTAAAQDDIKTVNTSRKLGKDRWEWSVFIKAPTQVLRNISCVEYKLPATMPKPNRRICAPGASAQPFAITGSGWGTFDIPILVTFKKGPARYLKHRLTFATSQ